MPSGQKGLPDAVCWEAIFNVILIHRRFDLLAEYVDKMRVSGLQSTTYIQNVLIRALATEGNIEKARELFDSMVDPPMGTSSTRSSALAPIAALTYLHHSLCRYRCTSRPPEPQGSKQGVSSSRGSRPPRAVDVRDHGPGRTRSGRARPSRPSVRAHGGAHVSRLCDRQGSRCPGRGRLVCPFPTLYHHHQPPNPTTQLSPACCCQSIGSAVSG